MKIGIAGPVEVDVLKKYFDNVPDNFPKGLGGTSINALIQGLLDAGHEVSVYTLDASVAKPIQLVGDRIKLFFGNYRTPARYRMMDFFKREGEQIQTFILQDKPEIVHAQWSYEFAIGTIRSQFPHLITLHDAPLKILLLKKDLYRFIRLLMHVWVMHHGRNFNVVSPYLINQAFIGDRATKVIPNGIQARYFSQKPKILSHQNIKVVSCLNGWGQLKNAMSALKAFQILYKKFGSKISYTIFGPDFRQGETAYLWAEKNGLSQGGYFGGALPHAILMDRLTDYDIMLHPSKEESFGLTLVEAMALGMPVVAGINSGAVPWVLQNGESGLLVDVNSPIDMAKGVTQLIECPDKYKTFSTNGLKNVVERFSHLKIAAEYANYYQEILMSKSKKA